MSPVTDNVAASRFELIEDGHMVHADYRREPGRLRVFRTPAWPLVGVFGVVGCLYLFTTLPNTAIWGFFIWNGLGVAVYLLYGRRKSVLAASEGV